MLKPVEQFLLGVVSLVDHTCQTTAKSVLLCQLESWALLMGMYPLLYLKWITNRDLLYSTWNSAQCYVAAWMGGSLEENGYMCVYS